MIFQLRKERKTVCDVEITTQKENDLEYIELSSSVYVAGYSLVAAGHVNEMFKVIDDFEQIEELRGWMWENYFGGKSNVYTVVDYNNIVKHIRETLKNVADKYSLHYIED